MITMGSASSDYSEIIAKILQSSSHDFSNIAIFVPNITEKRIFIEEFKATSTQSIILPRCYAVENLYQDLPKSFDEISLPSSQTHIINLLYNTFADKINKIEDLKFYQSQLKFLDTLLKFYDATDLISHQHLDISSILHDNRFQELLYHLPNHLNTESIKALDAKRLSDQYIEIYHIIPEQHWNMLQEQLSAKLEHCKNYRLCKSANLSAKSSTKSISTATQYNFTSSQYYPEAISYLLTKNKDKTCIICDSKLIAKRLYQYVKTHNSDKTISIKGHFAFKDEISIKFALKLAEIIFSDNLQKSIYAYFMAITNPIFKRYHPDNYNDSRVFHGREFSVSNLEEFFKEVENQDLSEFQNQLLEVRKKAQNTKSYIAKCVLFGEFLENTIDISKLENRNLYYWQELYHRFALQSITSSHFLQILQLCAENLIDIMDGEADVVIQPSSMSVSNKNQTIILANFDLENAIANSASLQNLLPANFQTDILAKFQYLYEVEKLILFNNNANFIDELNYAHLKLSSDTPQSIEKQIINTLKAGIQRSDRQYIFYKPASYKTNSIYATALRKLFCDPYIFFVDEILQLKPLEDFNQLPVAKNLGIICHDILHELLQDRNIDQGNFSTIFSDKFKKLAHNRLSDEMIVAADARIDLIAANVLNNINQHADKILSEETISYLMETGNAKIMLKARADRIEHNRDEVTIIDYKTGVLPPISHINSFEDPQTVLEAYILWCLENKSSAFSAYVKLIRVNSVSKPIISQDVSQILYEFEEKLCSTIGDYLLNDDAEFVKQVL